MIFDRIILCLFVFTSMSISAYSQAGNAGGAGMAFLKIGAGAQAVSMGEAYTAVADNAVATYWNPSALSDLSKTQLTISYASSLKDVAHNFASIVFPFLGGGMGLNMNSFNVEGFEKRANRPSVEPDGTFQSNYLSAGISYGRSLNHAFNAGVTTKFLFEKIFNENASGYAADLALTYTAPTLPVKVAVVVQNLGAMDALRNESTKLPALAKIGVAYEFAFTGLVKKALIAADAVKVFAAGSQISFGAEIELRKTLYMRAGYQRGIEGKGPSAGFGLDFNFFQLDYGYAPFSAGLGNGQSFSLTVDL